MSSSDQQKKDIKKDSKGKGKKEEDEEPTLSEEDQKLKEDLELLVERVGDSDAEIVKDALLLMNKEIRSSTSSMTSVPKPLKFLKPHYGTLKDLYEGLEGENKTGLADILSVLSMTMADPEGRDCLNYRLKASSDEIVSWGHEYVRHLAGEIGEEWNARNLEFIKGQTEKDNEGSMDVDFETPEHTDLLELVKQLLPFQVTHNAEAEACDLLMEIERMDLMRDHVDENNYQRVALYLLACANYVAPPEDNKIIKIVFDIYLSRDQYPNALRCALRLGDSELVTNLFESCKDELVRKQMGYMLARHHVDFVPDEDDDELTEIISNQKLSESFLNLARELEIMPPKEPEDVFKSHLQENTRGIQRGNQSLSSAKQNLASTLVSAFVNAGFKTDKLMTDEQKKWLYQNKEHGIMSASASVGALYLWDCESGVDELDPYLESENEYIQAGSLIGIGVCSIGTRDENETAMALLERFTEPEASSILKTGAMIGLGLAYAGSNREDVFNDLILPVLEDETVPMDVAGQAALAAGIIFVGSCNSDISEAIFQVLLERSEEQLKETGARYLCLGLGLVYLGARDKGEVFLESLKFLEGPIGRYAILTLDTCAFAGTGNVLKIQELLDICGEQTTEDEAENSTYQAVAVLGLALVAMAEELGSEMLLRTMNHLMQYGSMATRRAVPLALGMISICNPDISIMDTLSKLSHDADEDVARNAIMGLGLISAGTNNSRIATLLRTLASYYQRDPNSLFVVRLAQGLLHAGKGTITLQPYHSDRLLFSKVAMAGLLVTAHSCIHMNDSKSGWRVW
eukprot:TRINITY_DN1097_c0_g1_i2.p1 TRINITY_DN1097_c0_g1~~TRINITY_DN1097_c0_g1_i2.p1  ORF type:complete len:802 (-),score=283.37 TRINITY_DN1097_c0_g1_i2:723-3128(-)